MLVSQNLVFIHLTKCGGTYTRTALQDIDGPIRYEGEYHGSWIELPDEYRSMPVFTTVRNPYDWWVSWYHEMKRKMWFNPLARAAVITGNSEFEDMINFFHAAVRTGTNESRFVSRFYDEIEAAQQALPYNLDRSMFNYLTDKRCGVLSWRYARQLDGIDPKQLIIGRQESLIDDLYSALAKTGHSLSDTEIQHLRTKAKLNTTQRNTDYRSYYTRTTTRDAVADLDRTLIETFNYQF